MKVYAHVTISLVREKCFRELKTENKLNTCNEERLKSTSERNCMCILTLKTLTMQSRVDCPPLSWNNVTVLKTSNATFLCSFSSFGGRWTFAFFASMPFRLLKVNENRLKFHSVSVARVASIATVSFFQRALTPVYEIVDHPMMTEDWRAWNRWMKCHKRVCCVCHRLSFSVLTPIHFPRVPPKKKTCIQCCVKNFTTRKLPSVELWEWKYLWCWECDAPSI